MKIQIVHDNNYHKWFVECIDNGVSTFLSTTTNTFTNTGKDAYYFRTRKLAREALAKYKGVFKKAQKKRKAVKPKAKLFTAADRKEALEKLKDTVAINTFTRGTVAYLMGQCKWICTDGVVRGISGGQDTSGYFFKSVKEAEDAALIHFGILPKPVVVPQPKVFGYSYLLDMYDCAPGVADDMELTYRFLETLVDKLGMTRMSQPFVIHGPTKDGKELYPEKAGVSGWVPLIESGISIHSIEPTHFITLDVYSCRSFEKELVYNYAKELFGFKQHEETFLERGTKYHK